MYGNWGFEELLCDDNEEGNDTVMSYNIDDIVVCKVKDGLVVGSSEEYNDKVSLKIIGKREPTYSSTEYVVYVPDYELSRLRTQVTVSRNTVKDYGVHPRFQGDYMAYIQANNIVSTNYKADGQRCSNCDEYYDMAGLNMPDGTFYCGACRLNPWR